MLNENISPAIAEQYKHFAGQVERQKKLAWLGPLLCWAFSFFVVGFDLRMPAANLLSRRIWSLIFALVLAVVYFIFNLSQIKADQKALDEFAVTERLPRRLERSSYYLYTQIFSLAVIVLIVLGSRIIQSPRLLQTTEEMTAAGIKLNAQPSFEETFGGPADSFEVRSVPDVFAPRQIHMEGGRLKQGVDPEVEDVSNKPEAWQDLLFYELYEMSSENLAQKLYLQMDKVAAEEAAKELLSADQFVDSYGDYPGVEDLPEGVEMRYQARVREGMDGMGYYFLIHEDKNVMVASYFGELEAEDVLPYFLAQINPETEN
ncbi:MAG: hypothetical protein Q4E09_06845 [Eubacteriales bacterium]|nr:hypothetical protein [Eubacteriales bacterium]